MEVWLIVTPQLQDLARHPHRRDPNCELARLTAATKGVVIWTGDPVTVTTLLCGGKDLSPFTIRWLWFPDYPYFQGQRSNGYINASSLKG
jgi:hypothetical protein